MRLFLYNYHEDGNWDVTVQHRIFGARDERDDRTGTTGKALRDLHPGVVVIVRDTFIDYPDCVICGACVIDGDMVRQSAEKPLGEDLLWVDEKRRKRVLYPYRWPVQIASAPRVTRKRVEWQEFDAVGAIGVIHGRRLEGRPACEKKFRGNLIQQPEQVEALSRIFGLQTPKPTA